MRCHYMSHLHLESLTKAKLGRLATSRVVPFNERRLDCMLTMPTGHLAKLVQGTPFVRPPR